MTVGVPRARIFGFTDFPMIFAFKIDILSPIIAKLMKNAVKPKIRAHGALRGFFYFESNNLFFEMILQLVCSRDKICRKFFLDQDGLGVYLSEIKCKT